MTKAIGFEILEEDITIDLLINFLTKVDVMGPNECWNYTGYCNKEGYGNYTYKGKNVYSHRFSYALFLGPIKNECIRHLCNNPSCCNFNHLNDGTKSENNIDMVNCGKQRCQKLLMADVIEIKKMLLVGEKCATIAKIFNISEQTISSIKCNRTWKHVVI